MKLGAERKGRHAAQARTARILCRLEAGGAVEDSIAGSSSNSTPSPLLSFAAQLEARRAPAMPADTSPTVTSAAAATASATGLSAR